MTFCRGRSHDEFYYRRPEAITGDPPPPPYIDVRQPEILRRVLIKEVLRRAFRGIPQQIVQGDQMSESVHGQFGPLKRGRLCGPSSRLTFGAKKADGRLQRWWDGWRWGLTGATIPSCLVNYRRAC